MGAAGNAMKMTNQNLDAKKIKAYTYLSKKEIAEHGKALGLDYSETYSCYKGGEKHCGKCGTCRERIEALRAAGIEDHTEYES